MGNLVSPFVILLCLSGCGSRFFVPPKANPILEAEVGKGRDIYTLGTTAERRLVLVSSRPGNDGIFCAEASPDSIESISSNFGALASQSTGGQAATDQKVQLATALATSAALATNRSQGVLFYRDAVFALCQSRMNGYIDNQEYMRQLFEVRKLAGQMIITEIQQPTFHQRPNVTISAPTPVNPPPPA
jgi:hypothetical protein